jgi:type I restriction-modification system DNA methylase subunit
MTSLDRIVQRYIQDTKFLQERQVIAEKRRASIPGYNTIVHKFVDGIYTLDEFRHELTTRRRDNTFWSAHGNGFLMELNKLAKNHVPVSPDVETKFRVILHNLDARNVGQRIEQFYDLLTQEKKLLDAHRVSDSKIVSPGNSALIISLIAFWLDPIEELYICYPSLRSGLDVLLRANLLPIPTNLQIRENFDIKSQIDYQAVINIIDILATDQPKLRSGEYWAENFFLWITDNELDKSILHRRSKQRNAFPYSPLPSKASKIATDCITQLGFDKTAIVEEYQFSTTSDTYIKLNALVFAHPSRRDLDDYASITMLHAVDGHTDSELVTRLAETSAPIHLIHHENGFALWATGIQTGTDKKQSVRAIQIKEFIPYDSLKAVMHDYVDDLKPQHVIEVKQGRDTFKNTQFQNINLTHLSSWAEEKRSEPLVKQFELAMNALRYHPAQLPHDEITMTMTQLLGLLVFADTGALGEDIRLDWAPFTRLVEKAYKTYPHFFDIDLLLKRYSDAVEQTYNILRNVHYAGFTPDMLPDVYLASYTPQERKKLEDYGTPLYLARRILDNIPLEYLRPQERVVADFSCGWGSFLIAGQERLSKMSDSDKIPLQQSIYGNDQDKFLAQLARFGLLYTTAKDDWRVDNKDIFRQQNNQELQANVIIGNSLFAGRNRPNEEANRFLEHAIQQLKPGGYLAFIMPQSFASSQVDSTTRKKLLEECDILELWDIPRGLSQEVAVRDLIIFAQKKSGADYGKPSDTCVRTRTLQPASIDHVKSSGIFTASSLITDQSSWHRTRWRSESDQAIDCVFDYTTILPKSSWSTIEQYCYKLSDYTDQISKSKNISKNDFSLYVQWGKRVKLIIKPNKDAASEFLYLIDPTPTIWNWTFHMTEEVLTAILGWDVSNVWVIDHTRSSDVLTYIIQNIPIPRELSEQDCRILTNAILTLEETKWMMHSTSPATSQAHDEIDTILRKAYRLDDSTFQRLRQVTQWMDRSYITLDVPPDLSKANWFTSGVVEDVIAANNQIQLWVDGFDDLQIVDIVPSMPGWMLRPEAAFLTKFPREFRKRRKIDPTNINWAYFHPQPYMYMNEDELLTGISQHFVRPSQ